MLVKMRVLHQIRLLSAVSSFNNDFSRGSPITILSYMDILWKYPEIIIKVHAITPTSTSGSININPWSLSGARSSHFKMSALTIMLNNKLHTFRFPQAVVEIISCSATNQHAGRRIPYLLELGYSLEILTEPSF